MPVVDDAMYDKVQPFYLDLLHVNVARSGPHERAAFVGRFADASRTIADDLLASLLAVKEWRSRMVAGWMVAVNERERHLAAVRADLDAADLVYPQGLLVALATLPDDAGARTLREYLDRWLTPDTGHDAQPWVLAALEEVDRCLGSSHAAAVVAPGGPWEAWAGGSADSCRAAGTDWLTKALALVAECRSSG